MYLLRKHELTKGRGDVSLPNEEVFDLNTDIGLRCEDNVVGFARSIKVVHLSLLLESWVWLGARSFPGTLGLRSTHYINKLDALNLAARYII